VDDAFGATQFDWSEAAAWNRSFSHLQSAIRKGARVVFTSRDYIYRSARQHLKESAFPLLRESQVVIHVEQLSKDEKEQILYNHIRLGSQPKQFRRDIKPFLSAIAAHDRFLPEIARRLGNPVFTKNLVLVENAIREFVENPLELLKEVIRTLDSSSRAALALVFMRGGNLGSPINVSDEEQKAIGLIGGTLATVREALNALDGSLGLRVLNDGAYCWRFKHPTVRDAFGSLVAEDRELQDIYLVGTPIQSLLAEVTCGDVGAKGTKVVVPPDRYELVVQRLGELEGKKWDEQRSRNQFLARRCDKAFLGQFLNKPPGFIESLPIWSHLNSISEAPVFARLHRYGLLPESERKRFVAEVTELAVDTPDSGFLDEELRSIFTKDELPKTLQTVKDKLLPNLDDVIWSWRSNRSGSKQSVEDYFYDLISELDGFEEEFSEYAKAVKQIDEALQQIKRVVEETSSGETDFERDGDLYRSGSGSTFDSGGRSVFDDVDE
jgi:hypothetical protein